MILRPRAALGCAAFAACVLLAACGEPLPQGAVSSTAAAPSEDAAAPASAAGPAAASASVVSTAIRSTTVRSTTIRAAAAAPSSSVASAAAAPSSSVASAAAGPPSAAPPSTDAPDAPLFDPAEVSILRALPHDPQAFTQGLALRGGLFYESTGLYGRSSVRIVDPGTGEVIYSQALEDGYFGEGLEVVGDRVIQLTWREGTAFVWGAETLAPLGRYTYEGEGWGLCAFEDRFVMSDGSSSLTLRDLETFEVIGEEIPVRTAGGDPVERLNELECVGDPVYGDLVYANIWLVDRIAVIDADDGLVVGMVDASALSGELPQDSLADPDNVLNGIAYDPDRGVFYLGGKRWPRIFEVSLDTLP